MRVVFDTSVWMAAIRSTRGASFALLQKLATREFQTGVSVALWGEYSQKLRESVGTKGVIFSKDDIEELLLALAFYGEPVPIYFRLRPNLRDEGDNFLWECAAHFNARFLVTHNVRDFQNPQIQGYNFAIVTPGDFLRGQRALQENS